MKKLYSTQNRVLLYLLKDRLEDQKILCFFKNENPPLAGEIPPILAWPELWVDDTQFAQAQQIIATELAQQQEPKLPWVCPSCQEKLEGQFETCWNCGFTRESN